MEQRSAGGMTSQFLTAAFRAFRRFPSGNLVFLCARKSCWSEFYFLHSNLEQRLCLRVPCLEVFVFPPIKRELLRCYFNHYRKENGVEGTRDVMLLLQTSFSLLNSGKILSESCVIRSRVFLDGNFVVLNRMLFAVKAKFSQE